MPNLHTEHKVINAAWFLHLMQWEMEQQLHLGWEEKELSYLCGARVDWLQSIYFILESQNYWFYPFTARRENYWFGSTSKAQ